MLTLFLAWRFLRPMNIFVVSDAFERPVSTVDIPASFKTLRAEECAACHLREGKILGPFGSKDAPHPVMKLQNSNQICVRCHVVGGKRWDTFYRFPPCGTAAEVQTTQEGNPDVGIAKSTFLIPGNAGEIRVSDIPSLHCVECHMPLVERPLVTGGEVRPVRQHLWRGGHDPGMVKSAIEVKLREDSRSPSKSRHYYILTLTNVGAAHYLPTGTPDRHITVHFRLLDREGKVLKEQRHSLKRTILWRPLIVELRDTRLPYLQPRTYQFDFSGSGRSTPSALEVVVRYHLLDEARRQRIGYKNQEPIFYEVYRQLVPLTKALPGTP